MIGQQNSRHFLKQWKSKPKPIVFSPHAFSLARRQLHVFASNSDWLVVLFTSVAIGQSNYFGSGFQHSIGNRSNGTIKKATCYLPDSTTEGAI